MAAKWQHACVCACMLMLSSVLNSDEQAHKHSYEEKGLSSMSDSQNILEQ